MVSFFPISEEIFFFIQLLINVFAIDKKQVTASFDSKNISRGLFKFLFNFFNQYLL